MAIDLSTLKKTKADKPPRVLIYGPPGFGKTSLAAEFPNPVIMDIERGVPAELAITTLGDDVDSWESVMEALTALYTQEHDFKTLIVDSLDRLEVFAQRHVCKLNKWANIEDARYGKGYVVAADTIRNFIDGCNALRAARGMNIIYTAHSAVSRFDDPQAASYSKYDIRLNKHVHGMFEDEVDAILFVNQDLSVKSEEVGFGKEVKRAEGGGFRWIYTEARPSYNAKNRFGMPWRVKYDKGKGYAAIAAYLPAQEIHTKKKDDENNG
jgi:DNA polymerase III delta prime subunit